jgi:hypothetical protein
VDSGASRSIQRALLPSPARPGVGKPVRGAGIARNDIRHRDLRLPGCLADAWHMGRLLPVGDCPRPGPLFTRPHYREAILADVICAVLCARGVDHFDAVVRGALGAGRMRILEEVRRFLVAAFIFSRYP